MSKAPPAPNPGGAGEDYGAGRLRASPLARFLAKQRGISLARVSSTGPQGRIVDSDVLAHAEGSSAASPLDPPPSPVAGEGLGVGAGEGAERRLVAALIAFTLLITTLPYALGYFLAPVMGQGNSTFIGTPYNIDDYCNYLSWLRQMADGRFFLHNMFTTDAQNNLEFNVFFWLLGRVMAVTHCSPQAALQGARLVGGGALLWLIYRFYRHCLPTDRYARLTAFGFACLSSGFGWTQWHHWRDKNLPGGPVDAWQPEAYTFLSIYTSALMTVSTVFILGALYALLRGEQTGKGRYAVWAGLCGGVLGNMHSYDVLHLSAAWGLFLIVWTILKRGKGVAMSWARAAVALALTLPTTLYMYHVYNAEAVFKARANVPTLSPAVWHYFLAYGLVFLLAVVAVVKKAPTPCPSPVPGEGGKTSPSEFPLPLAGVGPGVGVSLPLVFALCWAVGGLLVCYLPFAFQRKMLMGEHIPLCLLAGWGAAVLVGRSAPRVQVAVLALLVLASAPSNVLFLVRDVRHLETDKSETHLFPFLDRSLMDVYGWIRRSTPADVAIVGFPGLCTYLPGEAGRVVWAGHWAETPRYGHKDAEFADAFDQIAPDDARHRFLLGTKAHYLFYPNDVSKATFKRRDGLHRFVELTQAPPPYLTQVYKNEMFTVYKIR